MTKTWLPVLLLALVAVAYLEFGVIETIELDAGYSTRGGSEPRVESNSQRTRTISQSAKSGSKSRLVAGERFASLEELVTDQQAAGFVRTGYFGKFWPATVAEITTDRDGISFVRQNGTRHNYTKFDGYDMKMVRLRAGDKETIVVFRSQQKRR